MPTNNASDRKQDDKKVYLPINSIEQSAYVERLSIPFNIFDRDGIYNYDSDNLYPQKIIAIKQRSWALSTATKTFADFIRGDGWSIEQLNDLVINRSGETGFDLLKFVSEEKSQLGFALHFNYNILGQITEIQSLDFEDLRARVDGKLEWRKDWTKLNAMGTEKGIVYNRFAPDKVIEQIRENGIEKYTGQVLYWTGTNKIYPLATFDAVLDSGQYQAEAELFKLRNVQNDFTASGIFKYPKNLEKMEEMKEAKKKLTQAVGANNAGRVILLGMTPDAMEKDFKVWETFERNNVDKLFETQNKESTQSIFSEFRQPTALNAISESGMFNQQSLQDAFIFYNSITEQDRKDVEKALKIVFEVSIWANEIKEVKILPKMLIKNEGTGLLGVDLPDGVEEGGIDENERLRLEAQAKLKGTVGGVDGILSIQEKVSQGVTQYNAGLKILTEIYGFEEDTAREILGDEKEAKKQNKKIEENGT